MGGLAGDGGGDSAAALVGPKRLAGAGTYAVLQCGDDSEHVRRTYGGYFRVFLALLGEEGETWHAYRASRGELPRGGDCDYDGYVITGSCSDAHGDDPWILELVDLLRGLHARRKRLFGVCFGHQILCRALGGKTGRSAGGWDIGVTCIHPNNAAIKLFSSPHVPTHLPVIEFHRDEVWELPDGAEALAKSNKTNVEMFRYGDHVMGIQGHPEYNKDILMSIIDRLYLCKQIQDCHVEAAKASLDAHEPNREVWKRLCRNFLKGKLQQQQLQQLRL